MEINGLGNNKGVFGKINPANCEIKGIDSLQCNLALNTLKSRNVSFLLIGNTLSPMVISKPKLAIEYREDLTPYQTVEGIRDHSQIKELYGDRGFEYFKIAVMDLSIMPGLSNITVCLDRLISEMEKLNNVKAEISQEERCLEIGILNQLSITESLWGVRNESEGIKTSIMGILNSKDGEIKDFLTNTALRVAWFQEATLSDLAKAINELEKENSIDVEGNIFEKGNIIKINLKTKRELQVLENLLGGTVSNQDIEVNTSYKAEGLFGDIDYKFSENEIKQLDEITLPILKFMQYGGEGVTRLFGNDLKDYPAYTLKTRAEDNMFTSSDNIPKNQATWSEKSRPDGKGGKITYTEIVLDKDSSEDFVKIYQLWVDLLKAGLKIEKLEYFSDKRKMTDILWVIDKDYPNFVLFDFQLRNEKLAKIIDGMQKSDEAWEKEMDKWSEK